MEHQHPFEDRLVSISELMKAVGLRSRTSVYRYVKFDPNFPRPLRLGVRSVRFRKSDLAYYMQHLAAPASSEDQAHD
jgi:predicted DNA-binding transcriptional regulator AlpA